MVTIHDVAKKANVSAMTVSRALNNPQLINGDTLKRVEQAIQELGYIPNKTASSLVSKKTKLLSVIITNISNPFFTNIVRGAEDKALQMGYQLILNNSDENIEKESKYIEALIARDIDGVLIAPTGDDSKKNLRQLIKRRIPFVLLDREVPDIESDVILGDNFQSIRLLIDHLVGLGHTRIALMNGPSSISNSRNRLTAFREALKINDIAVDDGLIFQTALIHIDTGRIIDQMMAMPVGKRPTAIVAANNFIGVDTIKSLRKRNLDVPGDMTVVCFDDPEPIPDFNPFLTVVAQPAYSFGYTGMQLLIERIEGKAPKEFRKVILPSELLVRKSSITITGRSKSE
jgi:LacI family transcriptional regulator